MATSWRPSCLLAATFKEVRGQQSARRMYHDYNLSPIGRARQLLPEKLDPQFLAQLPARLQPDALRRKIIKPIPSSPSIKKTCAEPVAAIQASQVALLDPSGVRTRMFDYKNREGAKVGDILHTTFKTGEPFSGVILSIKSRRQDTSVLVRNHLTRVGAEMSIKVFSPNVASMEIVQRSPKRKRRARLYYMRLPKHDMGSVAKIVEQYMKQKAVLTGGRTTSRTQQARAGRKR